MRRHVYYYTHLPGDCDAAAEVFSGDPAGWLPPPATLTPEGWVVDLRSPGVLPAGLAIQGAEVQIGAPTRPAGVLVRSISWHARKADRLFPVLTGDLELAPLPVEGCQLSLTATYRPPLSVIGGIGDRVLGHRVAEACVRWFVLDAVDRLSAATLHA